MSAGFGFGFGHFAVGQLIEARIRVETACVIVDNIDLSTNKSIETVPEC